MFSSCSARSDRTTEREPRCCARPSRYWLSQTAVRARHHALDKELLQRRAHSRLGELGELERAERGIVAVLNAQLETVGEEPAAVVVPGGQDGCV